MANTLEWRREVRNLAKEIIPRLLRTSGPWPMADIYASVQNASEELCDDAFPCEHKGQPYGAPEWRHQVRWALQDLKHEGVARGLARGQWGPA